MNITEVRVKLMQSRADRLRAFCSVTLDNDFVVHDLRVIEGRKGLFVAMPSRKLSDNCPHCKGKNELQAKYCSECGSRLPEGRSDRVAGGRDKLHVDVAHPINTPCREMLQATVLTAYQEEERRARQGLPPLHEYAADGLEELAAEEISTEFALAHADVAPPTEESGPPDSASTEPEPASGPGDQAQAGLRAASGEQPLQEGPAEQDEAKPTRVRKAPPSGAFGEGIL